MNQNKIKKIFQASIASASAKSRQTSEAKPFSATNQNDIPEKNKLEVKSGQLIFLSQQKQCTTTYTNKTNKAKKSPKTNSETSSSPESAYA